MHIVLLRFTEEPRISPELAQGHGQWLDDGFRQGVFLLAGSLPPERGGALLALGGAQEVRERVARDPFVAADIVTPELIELVPGRADERLAFLVEGRG